MTITNNIESLLFDSYTYIYSKDVNHIPPSHSNKPVTMLNNILEPLLFNLYTYTYGEGDAHKQPDDDEFDSAKETDDFTIKYGAEFPKCDNTSVIIQQYVICENSKEHQFKKKIVSEDQRDRESKKYQYCNSCSIAELEHCWEKLLNQYLTANNYLNQLWKSQQSWAKIYIFTSFCAKYKNALPTWGLPSIQSVFFELVQNAIKKYLILESASMQNAQILQSFSSTHEYAERYFKYKYNALQASLKNIINMQEYAYRFDIAKSGLKFTLENRLINKFEGLIVKFIENYSGVATNKHVIVDITLIENPKKLKHKGCPKLFNSIQSILQDLNTNQNLNSKQNKSRRIIKTDAK
ncbi:3820_t:CDS:2, partial [Dentiscutata erythropus]